MADAETKTLLVTKENGSEFRITVPADARTTFGPWSPPSESGRGYNETKALTGTLRVYQGKSKTSENILAVFSGVASFRDITSVEYEEKVTQEVGATVWRSDKDGYHREEMVRVKDDWGNEESDPLQLDVKIPEPVGSGNGNGKKENPPTAPF